MNPMAKAFQLGRGLGSLIPQKRIEPATQTPVSPAAPGASLAGERVLQIARVAIDPNPHQPRQHFGHDELEDLISSIKAHGIVQPLIVSPGSGGRYVLIAGERRWRAAEVAGLITVPAIVRSATDQERLELALIENIQRQDLNALEEATGYQRLHDEFGLTQEEVAKRVGKSRAQIANTMRLLALPREIQDALRAGRITFGHAKVIMGVEGEREQLKLYQQIVREGLPVRFADAKARGVKVKSHVRQVADPELASLTDELQRSLGTRVHIRGKRDRGVIEVLYFSLEELTNLVRRLSDHS